MMNLQLSWNKPMKSLQHLWANELRHFKIRYTTTQIKLEFSLEIQGWTVCLFKPKTRCLFLVESGVSPRVQDRGRCQTADHLARVITLIDNQVKHEHEMESSDLVMTRGGRWPGEVSKYPGARRKRFIKLRVSNMPERGAPNFYCRQLQIE